MGQINVKGLGVVNIEGDAPTKAESEKIKEAMEKQVRLQMEINKAIAKIQDDTKRIALTQKDIEKIRESTRVKKLFRDLQEIPEFIRKKVG